VSGVKAELLRRLMVDGNDADSDIRPLAAEAQSFIPPPSKLDYIPDEKPDTQSPIEGCVDSSSAVFSAMSVPQLKEELRQRGLKVSGVKAELLGRLMVDGNGADSDIRPLAPDMVDRNDAESESDIRPPVKEARSFIPPSKLFFVPDEESDNKALPADVAEAIISDIAVELNFERWRVAGAVKLFQEGNLLPFIARYRKEVTGELDETALRAIESGLERAQKLEVRRATIISILTDLDKLTPELRAQFEDPALTLKELDDLYLPLRPRRRTKASDAREKGLQPLADAILGRPGSSQLFASGLKSRREDAAAVAAAVARDAARDLNLKVALSPTEALLGARAIVAEETMEMSEIRKAARDHLWSAASLKSTTRSKKKIGGREHSKEHTFRTYADFITPLRRVLPHHVLAINRGEKVKALSVDVAVDEFTMDRFKQWLEKKFQVEGEETEGAVHPSWREELVAALDDGIDRLLLPSLSREWRSDLTETAEAKSFEVYAVNLRQKLLQPPLKGLVVLAVDPGLRTGCKVAVVSPTGVPLAFTTLKLSFGKGDKDAAAVEELVEIFRKHGVQIVAIGNGTGNSEATALVVSALKRLAADEGTADDLKYTIVDESGASVYSASEIAARELPDLDVTIRGAVSLARRVQDPLSEYVKIDAKALSVGMYQHDVNQKALADELARTVCGAVTSVGVDLNQASPALLSHVAGLSAKTSEAIIVARDSMKDGRFDNVAEVLKVKGVGPNAFKQAAGFLRVYEGKEPFDATEVHPESYPLLRRCLEKLGSWRETEVAQSALQSAAEEAGMGELTLRDALTSLRRPRNFDPRDTLLGVPPPPLLSAADAASTNKALTLGDIKVGMEIPGIVKNVVDFGAFVDLGCGADGLLHKSNFPRGKEREQVAIVGARSIFRVTSLEITDLNSKKARISLDCALGVGGLLVN